MVVWIMVLWSRATTVPALPLAVCALVGRLRVLAVAATT